MSITYCNDCFALIDTDKDTEFYDFKHKTKTGYGGHCFICRAQFCECDEISNGETCIKCGPSPEHNLIQERKGNNMLSQKWKPISTAPKGVYLLLYCADGFFNADTLMEVATVEQFVQTATHWQALPTPPEEKP